MLLGVGAVLLIALAIGGWQARQASDALSRARDEASVLKQQLIDGDVDAARVTLERLDRDTTAARESTNGPLWWVGGQVPVLGRNVDALHVAAEEIDRITDDALPGIVDVADAVRLETFRPRKGRMNLAAVAKAAPALARADTVFTRAHQRVGAFDADGLIGPLKRSMVELQGLVSTSASAASAADDAARLLPGMLGADGKRRTYLLMVNNNAEVRSIGGMPGSIAVIAARNGRIRMGDQETSRKVTYEKPVGRLSKDERSVFPTSVATDMRDTGIVPDFPRAAQLASALAGKKLDQTFDGVIGVDPVALAQILAGVGRVELADDTVLTGTNAVATLLNGIYLKYPLDAQKQDDVFESAARRIFDATVSGRGNSQKVVQGLVRAVQGGHLKVWSRHPAEQKRLLDSGIADSVERAPRARPQVGVYVNDSGSTKMGYYLSMSTTVRTTQCRDGIQDLQVVTRLTSNAPANVARLGPSVVGLGKLAPPGSIDLVVRTVAPSKGSVRTITIDGTPAPVSGGRLGDRQVSSVPVRIPPNQSVLVVTKMQSGPDQDGLPLLDATPGIVPNGDVAEGGCG